VTATFARIGLLAAVGLWGCAPEPTLDTAPPALLPMKPLPASPNEETRAAVPEAAKVELAVEVTLPAAEGPPGRLWVHAMPWARVFVDGEDSGRWTPVRALQVSPGHHLVELRAAGGAEHRVEVYVTPGEDLRIVHQF